MELNEFLVKFYEPETKINDVTDAFQDWEDEEIGDYELLEKIRDFFPEALQNCIDKACEKQRENCAMEFYKKELFEPRTSMDTCRNAEQPKIDELI